MKIKVLYGIEPILEIKHDEDLRGDFGLHRDRNPDAGWGEYRWSRLDIEDKKLAEVDMTPELKQILIEDICKRYHGKAYLKLKEFDLIKDDDADKKLILEFLEWIDEFTPMAKITHGPIIKDFFAQRKQK
jgi:hypothetical protein